MRDGEYRVQQPDGGWRWVQACAAVNVLDARGRPVRRVGSLSDIDAQKRTEEALRRSEERYQLAVDGSNEGLWDWDLRERHAVPVGARAAAADGRRSPARRCGRAVNGSSAPTTIPMTSTAVRERTRRRTCDGETPHFSVEYRLRHHRGDWHWYRQRGIAVRDAGGRAVPHGRLDGRHQRAQERRGRTRASRGSNCARRRSSRRSARWPAASRTTSTTSCRRSSATASWRRRRPATARRMRRHIDAAMTRRHAREVAGRAHPRVQPQRHRRARAGARAARSSTRRSTASLRALPSRRDACSATSTPPMPACSATRRRSTRW